MATGIDMGWYVYTADDGTQYSIRLATQIGGLAAAGFGARDASKPVIPQGMKPRHILLIDPATGNRRLIKIGSVTATLWTTPATTVSLKIIGVVDPVVYSQTHRTGEVARIPNPVHVL